MKRDRPVLPPELCQRIYFNFVRYPWISLEHILDFELYEVVLWDSLPKPIFVLNTTHKIIDCLTDPATFEHFQSVVTDVVKTKECCVNPHAINPEDWKIYVVNNTRVHDKIRHWRTGTLNYTHHWSFLHLQESKRDELWHCLTLL